MTRFMLCSPLLTDPDAVAGVDIVVTKVLFRGCFIRPQKTQTVQANSQQNSVPRCGQARFHVNRFAVYGEIILPQQPYQKDQTR